MGCTSPGAQGMVSRSPPFFSSLPGPHRLQHMQGPCSTLEGPTWKTGTSLEACSV